MRKPVLFTIVTLLALVLSAYQVDKISSKKKILVISFIKKNFISSYETQEIAERNNTNSETILTILEEKIYNSFPKNEEIEFVKCTDKPKSLQNNLSFSYGKKDVWIPNLSEIDNPSFNKMLASNEVDYIVFINGYEMNWVGDPQYKVENNIHFTILGRDKKEIATSKYSFSTSKLISFKKMEKKIQKITKKIYMKHIKKLN